MIYVDFGGEEPQTTEGGGVFDKEIEMVAHTGFGSLGGPK